MKCTVECYNKDNVLVEYFGTMNEKQAENFMLVNQDIYPKIRITHGLKPDCKKMLQGYETLDD